MAHLSQGVLDRFAALDSISPTQKVTTTHGGFPLPSFMPGDLDALSPSTETGRSNGDEKPLTTSFESSSSKIPLDFLSSYPFPAFVLLLPIPLPNGDTEPTSIVNIQFTRNALSGLGAGGSSNRAQGKGPFEPVWTNERYETLSRNRDFLDMIDTKQLVDFSDWVSGVSDFERKELRAAGKREMERRRSRDSIAGVNDSTDSVSRIREKLQAYDVGQRGAKIADKDLESFPKLDAIEETGSPDLEDNPRDLLDDIKEKVERDREASLSSRSDDLEIEEELEGDSAFDIVFRAPLSQGGEKALAYTLTKTRVAMTPTNKTSSYFVIQAVPILESRGVLAESPVSNLPSRLGSYNYAYGRSAETSSTATLTNVHRNSFPFYGQNNDDEMETPDASGSKSRSRPDGGRYKRRETDIDEDETPSADYVDEPFTNSDVSGLFPRSEPIVMGGADLDQLISGPRKPVTDNTSVEYLLQNTDWSKTSLGPRSQWPQSLRTMLSLVQALPLQATLWWGPELVLLYNEHYANMIKGKHPSLFGMEGAKGYAEIWAGLGPVAKTVMSGIPASQDDDLFLFETNDPEVPLLEYYHSWYWTPIFDTDFRRGTNKCDPRKFLGLFNFTRNTTRKVIAERRLRAMRELSDNLQASRNIEEYNSAILSSLGSDEIAKDVPFALLYHVSRDGEENETLTAKATSITDDDRSIQGGRTALLKLKLQLGGSLGVPKGHRSAVKETIVTIKKPTQKFGGLDPARTSSPTLSMISNLSTPGEEGPKPIRAESWPFKEALQGRKAVMVDDASGLIDGFELRSWDGLPKKAILLPICNDSSAEIPSGVLVIGLNLRRTYDQDYVEWHHQLRLSIYSGLLQVKSVEAEAQRIEELRSIDEIKNNWISNVSHELRLPLTLISGPVDDLLSECQNNNRIRNLLTITKRNVNRLRRLVDQLMDFSRIEGGRFAIACRPMPIGSFTRDLANLFRNAIERTKLRYDVICEEDNGRHCYIDPDMYEKIALNLIGNAFKYCHEGGVAVSLKYTDQCVVLQVSDTGVGIPRSQMHKIGERFFRVKTHSRSHEGTGIGLSLTKELIRLMGGSLDLESWVAEETPDGQHGSVFTVKLPLGFTHLPPSAIEETIVPDGNRNRTFAEGMVDEALQWNRDNESSNENSSDSSGVQTRPSVSERSGSSLDPNTLFFDKSDIILVVDDSKDLRTYLTSILQPYVGQVIEAADGEIGLAKAKEFRPNLIISDIQMPNMDGFALLQAVKSDEQLRWTPVILLTARAGEGERVEGLLTGAEDYMTKPFQSRELVARVSLQVQLGKRRKVLEEAFATRLEEVEKRREAAELERKRQELLIDVTSHELRNPTSAIIQCSQMIGEDIASLRESVQAALSAGQSIAATEELVKQLLADEELCQNINSCGQSQSRIADDVLALARINLDMMQFTYQSTDIRRRAKEVVAPFVLEAKARGIELILDLDDKSLDPVPHVMTDPFRLGQVLVNLVSNAMRYSGDGPVKRVVINLAMRPEPPTDSSCVPPSVPFPSKIEDGDHIYLYVSVTDSGPGLAAEDVQILFRRFSQATKNTNKAFGGSGLGLWISKQISTQMGGRIEVDSEYGKGCTFRFFVRVLASERHEAIQVAEPQALASPALAPEPMVVKRKESVQGAYRQDGSPCRVLVVEDNMINQTILLKQLRKRGVVVEAADHGQAAVDRLRQVCSTAVMPSSELDKPFDVVLMDLEMPVISGLEAIQLIRKLESAGKLRRSHVIALTGNARQQQIEDALAAGMDSVLIKPYKIDEVMARINERVEAAKGEGQ